MKRIKSDSNLLDEIHYVVNETKSNVFRKLRH